MPDISKLNIDGTIANIKDATARSNIADIEASLVKVSTSSDGLAPKVTNTSAYLKGDGTWSTPTNTTYSTATSKTNGLMSSSDKSKLDGIASGANKYVLPTATDSVLGGIKVGSNITEASDGTISITTANVTDALGYTPAKTDTTYSTATTTTNGLMSSSDKTKLDSIEDSANNYTLPTATSAVLGGVKVGSNITEASDGTISLSKSNVTTALGYTPVETDTTYSTATTAANGLMSSSDKTKLDGIEAGAQVNTITGIKGNAESSYRTGNVNLTPANIGAVASSEKGAASGVAPLNASGLIDSTYLPSYVDDVLEYASKSDFPATGESGKIYVDTSVEENNTYRWSGSTYILIAKNTNTTYSISKSGSTITLTGSDGSTTTVSDSNTTYAAATTAANGLMSSTDKTKLDGIATGANNYTLPTATSSVLGGVKVGSNITNSSGTISISKSNVTSALGYTPPTTNTTYGTMGAATSAAAGKAGLVPAPAAGKQGSYLRGDGTWSTPTNTTYGTVSTSANGLAPKVTSTSAFLRGDGTWATPTNTTYGAATTAANGLMSSTDKTKLDGIATGAEANQNAFANIVVGTTTIAADVESDSLTLAGSNITITPDATNDKITIGITKANVTSALGYTPPTTNTTYSVVSTSANGLAPKVTSTSAFLKGDGTWAVPTNTTYGTMGAATSAAAGSAGLVPAPAKGKQTSFLRGDGTWVVPTNTTYGIVSTSTNGLAPKVTNTSAFLKGDGTWAVPTNTTYTTGTSTVSGLTKLYTGTGTNTDGTMTQSAINTALSDKAASSHTHSKSDITDFPTIPTVNNATISFTQNGISKGSFTVNQSSATTIALTDTNTTYGTMGAATSAAAGSAGLVPAPAKGKQTSFLRGDGTWVVPTDTNTTYGTMGAATSAAAGKAGLVPAPAAGKQGSYLRGDGTWATPTNTTYGTVSTSANGLAPKVTSTSAFLRGDGTWVVPTDTTYGAATTAAQGLTKLSYVTGTTLVVF